MNKPNQVVPSFASVYLTADVGGLADEAIPFNIVETDGTNANIYDISTRRFTAPASAWYDLDAQVDGVITKLYIVKNEDTAFPVAAVTVDADEQNHIRVRVKMALGENIAVYVSGAVRSVVDPGTGAGHATNAIFTMVKRFDDTKTF